MALEIHITSVVNDICYDIERIILYEVQANQSTKYIDNNKKRHDELIRDKRYIWELTYIRKNPIIPNRSNVNESILIPRLVKKLKETFIGCDIIIDPLKTYVIIDWS